MLKHFILSEFDSPDSPGSGVANMKMSFVEKLDQAREISGCEYVITSGYRTPSHNSSVGGSPTSSHMRGCAADIAYFSNKQAVQIIQGLVRAGFRRIGLADTFIHVDADEQKNEAYWGYE